MGFTPAAESSPQPRKCCLFQAAMEVTHSSPKWLKDTKLSTATEIGVVHDTRSDRPRSIWLPSMLNPHLPPRGSPEPKSNYHEDILHQLDPAGLNG